MRAHTLLGVTLSGPNCAHSIRSVRSRLEAEDPWHWSWVAKSIPRALLRVRNEGPASSYEPVLLSCLRIIPLLSRHQRAISAHAESRASATAGCEDFDRERLAAEFAL